MIRRRFPLLLCIMALLAVYGFGCSSDDENNSDGDSDGQSENSEMENGDGISDGDDNGESDDENSSDGDEELPENTEDPENSEDSENSDGDVDEEMDPDDIGNPDYNKDPHSIELRGACPAEKRIGGFKVEMNEDMGYTAIDGVVKNGIIPNLVPEVVAVDGDCKLLRKRRLVCNPSCEPGTTCGFDLTCIPTPVGQDAGFLVFRGLSKTVLLKPISPTNTYSYNKLDHPGFDNDSVIQLASTDGYFGEMEMFGVGVSQLTSAEDKWVIDEGEALTIHWTAPGENTRSRVFVQISIDQHGLTPLTLTCDFPDSGEASVSAPLIDQLIGAGVTGYPSGSVVRRTMDSMNKEESCVDFMISSVRQIAVEVSGHIPCTSDQDCPDGLDCNEEIQQCQ